MRRLHRVLLVLVLASTASPAARAQTLVLPPAAATDRAALRKAMPAFARAVLAQWRNDDRDTELNTRFRLESVAERDRDALKALAALRLLRQPRDPVSSPFEYAQYELFLRARLAGAEQPSARARVVRATYARIERPAGDVAAYRMAGSFVFDLGGGERTLQRALAPARDGQVLSLADAVALCRAFHTWSVYDALLPVMGPALRDAESARYVVDSAVRVPLRDGNALSAVIVRPRKPGGRQPAVLELTIYAGEQNHMVALEAAAHGFVGIVATTRGKRASRGPIEPFAPDAADAYDLIAWIARQAWSSGAVGMIGGSYSGFTQWAAAKRMPRALKTIVPAAAIVPGVDSPREHGIVQNFQYPWTRYVGNAPLNDEAAYGDRARWAALDSSWFARGTAYRDLDLMDGAPNPIFRRWLEHPAYDAYWQAMVPQGAEYAAITIPVLSITGYFDGAQLGALHYMRAHQAALPNANHTLLIGPWDHFGSQRRPVPVLGSHVIDAAARVDIIGLIYDWMAHVLRGAPRPALLADRVNFEVMGANRWEHVASLDAMATDTLRYALAGGAAPSLVVAPSGPADNAVVAVVETDFRDRAHESGTFIEVSADTTLDVTCAARFDGPVLARPMTLSGAFTGTVAVSVNGRDVDVAVELHERGADGRYRQLSYALGRSSLMRDPTRRQLLTSDAVERLPLPPSRIVSRVIPAGSRLVVLVRVQKSSASQLNYGSGRDPSDETIADATRPLRVTLHAGSVIAVPVRP